MDIDTNLSSTSENPLQNKVIHSALNDINTAITGKQGVIRVVSESEFTESSELNTGEIILVYED